MSILDLGFFGKAALKRDRGRFFKSVFVFLFRSDEGGIARFCVI